MFRNGKISVIFDKVPPGTHYREGAWSWVHADIAHWYIEQGYGREWKPDQTTITLPDDLPGRAQFIRSGYYDIEVIKNLNWESVAGIGPKRQQELEDYFAS